jgi:CubicO group peptidase (beta-lactamase class C family)
MQYAPGTQWVYNTGASQMIGDMVVEASGIPLSTFVRQYYSDLVESASPPGIAYPLGTTILPRDMAKLGQVFLDDGMWKTTRVVSSEWVQQSTQARFPINATTGYGYQWWTRRYSTSAGVFDAFYAAGNGGQYIIVVENLELVVVFTGGHFGSGQAEQVHALMERRLLPAFAS